MRFNYNDKTYEIGELKEIKETLKYDMVVIFEVQKCVYHKDQRIVLDKELWGKVKGEDVFEELQFINYFYGASESTKTIKENAIHFIDDYEEKKR